MALTLDSYFSHLNSLSQKIARDVNRVKANYDRESWHSLTLNDQEEILNNHFIKPDIYNKYRGKSKAEKSIQSLVKTDMVYSYNGQDLHTYIYQNVGMKILHDENNAGNCRDEHSYPFSYRTKSQINIPSIESMGAATPLIDVLHPVKSSESEAPSNNTNKISIKSITKAPHYKSDLSHSKNSVGQHYNEQKTTETSQLLFKRHGSKNSISTDFSDNDNEFKDDIGQEENVKLLSPDLQIPKGFDFLSNW